MGESLETLSSRLQRMSPRDTIAETVALAAAKERLASAAPPPPQLDRYRLRRRIGSGGSGLVYLAEDPELEREVVIKLLRDPTDTEHLRREARMLARLNHPNIVHVYDVGQTASVGGGEELVFVVMERIEGADLRRWLEASPPPAEILRVFAAAARGLAAAHEAGIVHGDFKPANVLVGTGTAVRVLDFGLARGHRDVDGPRGGTPKYMAPEQSSGRPDARADQYAFCLSLYEALTGVDPFDAPTPSARSADKRAGLRTDRARAIPWRYRGVVCRGLQPDPGRRFESMTALISALDRAHRRPRRMAAVGAAIALAGLATVSWPAPLPEVCAGRSFDRAWSRSIASQTEDAFMATGRSYAETTHQTVDALLSADARQWEALVTEHCAAVAESETSAATLECLSAARTSAAILVASWADVDDAELERAVDAAAELPPADACVRLGDVHPEGRRERRELAQAWQALAVAAGHHAAGEDALARHGYEKLMSASAPHLCGVRGRALLRLGVLEISAGNPDVARDRLWQASKAAACAGDEYRLAQAWIHLALNEVGELEDHPEASRWIDMAAELVPRLESKHAVVVLERARAVIAQRLGDFAVAETHARAALRTALDADDTQPATLISCRVGLAAVLLSRGRLSEARALYEESLAHAESIAGAGHPMTRGSLMGLATLESMDHNYERARQLYERVLAMMTVTPGLHTPAGAVLLHNMARVAVAQGRFDDAMARYEEALATLTEIHGPDHVDLARIHEGIGELHLERGDRELAREFLERALAIQDGRLRPVIVARTRFALARALGRDDPRARRLAREAADAYDGTAGNRRTLVEIETWLGTGPGG